ncbi:hypothetical protein BDK51DRAFT_25978 [Blyttiomyces helicus]|uniref:Uncharacterized protein n=1 Tax=Blyttiomyces helicus TaxID=388810 RepID=A0A4P9W0A4_9FUNG|nr:hypothetical protein BDK51DRAFT_25978 [Blyttiomyces helicus]|eukprot:RKO83446.1 hypothetical protein BDK51DRAFT_25978 [Blyttiomyces helicus]
MRATFPLVLALYLWAAVITSPLPQAPDPDPGSLFTIVSGRLQEGVVPPHSTPISHPVPSFGPSYVSYQNPKQSEILKKSKFRAPGDGCLVEGEQDVNQRIEEAVDLNCSKAAWGNDGREGEIARIVILAKERIRKR